MKEVTLIDFLTFDQISRCAELQTTNDICEEVIIPNIKLINQKLGQLNDPMFIAQVVKSVLDKHRAARKQCA